MRQYAEERLLEEDESLIDDVRRRHGMYYAQLLRAHHDSMNIRQAVMSEILSDYGNFFAAWSWAVKHGDLAAAW